MDTLTRIKTLENELIHSKGPTIYELANSLNRSHSYLCRISSTTEELPFPLEIALPAMKLKKNYNLLRFMALECGFALVKVPKPVRTRGEETEMVSHYQTLAAETVRELLNFLANPERKGYEKVTGLLNGMVSESISVRLYIDKKASPQLELGI